MRLFDIRHIQICITAIEFQVNGLPKFAPFCEFFVGDFQYQSAIRHIQLNPIAVLYQSQIATICRFGRNV